jgi:hydroxyacylglutathione hydrolase
MCHICLLAKTETPALFSGDTLFAAGAGNCGSGGDPVALFQTFTTQLAELPDEISVYPGHDYIVNNLGFTVDREPDNQDAVELLSDLKQSYDANQPRVTTLGLERKINTFFRLNSKTLIRNLRASFPEMPMEPSRQEVFVALRELRNHW